MRIPTEIDDQLFVNDKENSSEYVVDKLVAHQKEKDKDLYKVRWHSYAPEHGT